MKDPTKYSFLGVKSNHNWRPWPVRVPFLFFFILVCAGLYVSIEFLIGYCSPNGCPVLGGASRAHVPTGASIVYNFSPTVVGICFGLLWSVAQHDYMRMEPWFQMSRPDGATAKDSLLVEYPYLFPLIVPLRAAKRGYLLPLPRTAFLHS